MKWYQIVLSYLKNSSRSILAVMIFYLLFFSVCFLAHLPLQPFAYSFVLSLSILVVFLLWDFGKYWNTYYSLYRLLDLEQVMPEHLPDGRNDIEKIYVSLFQKLYDQNTQLMLEQRNRYTQMLDYYTLWAHQIKTPIASMDLLLQTETQFEKKKALSQELFKIGQYVEMALHYLRLEQMSSDLLLAEYPLHDIVRQVVRKYSVLFIQDKTALQLDELSCRVLTDEKWLGFALEQIISNAVKYARGGRVSIYMEADAAKTLVIKDNGIGISPEDIPRVFEKGFTGYNGRMQKKSTGIGLYLCKQILDKLSHHIEITSCPGEGTIVKIDFDRKPVFGHLTKM